MLRSTSVKNDLWKPVKLLARQSFEGSAIASSCSSKGDLVAVLTDFNLNIFNNRELLEIIKLEGGKKVHVTEDATSIFVITSDKFICYDNWGKVKWELNEINHTSHFSISPSGNIIILSKGNNIKILNRFGDVTNQTNFSTNILSVSQYQKNIVALTENSINIFKETDKITKVASATYSKIYSSKDGIMAISEDSLSSFSYSGSEIWSKNYNITKFSFSNKGIKHVFVKDSKTLVCQDRNGDKLWDYTSREKFDGVSAVESGEMVGLFSNKAFHVIDGNGQQSWSYQAREKVINFSFPNYGGDVIIISESKIHWFQNEGFLRMQIDGALDEVENLFEKVTVYDKNIENINHDIQKAKSLQVGNFTLLKESFQLIYEIRNRLLTLQQRHVGYLDALPSFLENLGLQGAHTDEMIPLLYPYFSLHSDLHDISYLTSSIQRAENSFTKLNRFEHKNASSDSASESQQTFLNDAKVGISAEINNLNSLLVSTNKDINSLEFNVKEVIINWLKTADLDPELKPFLFTYQKSSEIRNSKIGVINDKIDNHMAFVDYTLEQEEIALSSSFFSSADKINLNLNIKNKSNQKIDNIYLRMKVDGSGLSLADPPSGVYRLDYLRAGESFSPIFKFNPNNRNLTKIALILQYQEESGRTHTIWLGEIESNFLGCHIRPFDIESEKHDDLRLKYKDSTAHSVINVEGLSLKKILKISKDLPGLHLCDSKVETTRSIVYHSGESTLDDSNYLSMIFLRILGPDDSLRTVLELICHAPDIDKSTMFKEEIVSYLKYKLLESNGRLV